MFLELPLTHDLAAGSHTTAALQLAGPYAIAELHLLNVTGTVKAKLQQSLNAVVFTDVPDSEESIDEGQELMAWGLGPLALPKGVFVRVSVSATESTGSLTKFKLFSNE